MTKFSVDYTDLQSKLSQNRAFRLVDVRHKIKKVAFDVVRFVDSDRIDDLWQIHRDGEDEYIVAMYDDKKKESSKIASASPWTAVPDGAGKNVNVFYCGNPIKRVAIASMGIPPDDAYIACRSLTDKLANDKSFLTSFIKELTAEERKTLDNVNPSILAGK